MRTTVFEATRHMRENTPLNQMVAVLSNEIGRMEQDAMQRRPSSPIEARAMMLDGVDRILAKAEEVGLVTRT